MKIGEVTRNEGLSVGDVMSPRTISDYMKTTRLGREVVYLKVTDSTNVRADWLAREGAKHGTLVVADMQTAGKGRRGRRWEQKPGEMLAFSLVLRPNVAPDNASMITLLAAHSVAVAIEKMTGVSAYIKWPNDIVIHNKKAVGILTEMHLEQGKISHVILGIGINAGTEAFPKQLSDMATSLYMETGIKPNRSEMLAEVLWQLETDYEVFLQTEDLSGILNKYNAHLINQNKEVKILDPKGEYTGISRGITKTGELLVERPDGKMECVYAGEVSVRGLYGYV